MGLEQLRELLVQLVQLGGYRVLAVRLVRVIGIEFLMVIFRRIEFRERLERRHHWVLKRLRLVKLFDEHGSFLLLRFIGIKNRGAVLRTGIVTLSIERRGIVGGKENRHQITERNFA